MSENSLEFQPMPGIDAKKEKVRSSFRVPTTGKDKVQAVLYEKNYPVENLSPFGVAIQADSCSEFESGQIIKDAALLIGGQTVTGLTGKVIHCSVSDSGTLQFGLVWLNTSSGDKNSLETLIRQIKENALKEP